MVFQGIDVGQSITHQSPTLSCNETSVRTDSVWQPSIGEESVCSATTMRSPSVFDDDSTYAASVTSFSSEVDGIPNLGNATYPCEFAGFTDCPQRFEIGEEEAWIHHIMGAHLQNILPNESRCWFCDHAKFVTRSNQFAAKQACFRQRMHHIAHHIREDVNIRGLRIRPDFELLDHLERHQLISAEIAAEAKLYSEMPHTSMFNDEIPEAARRKRPERVIIENSRGGGGRRQRKNQQYHH